MMSPLEEVQRIVARHGTPTVHGDPSYQLGGERPPCRCWDEAGRIIKDLKAAGWRIVQAPNGLGTGPTTNGYKEV